MKYFTQHKGSSLVLATLLGSAIAGSLLAQQQADPAAALRELNIMRNIFGATLDDRGSNRRRWRMSEPDALYLSGQGMVFTFDLPGGGFFFSGFSAPVLPPDFNFDGGNFDFDFDFDLDIDVDDGDFGRATQEQISAYEAYQRQLRELNEQMQVKQREMRERTRELRRLQRGRGDEEAANEAEIDRLESELESREGELRAQVSSYTQLAQEFQAERTAEARARREEQTALVFDTLCDYGSTLRSLANGEHVSLVFRHYERDQSQVYVLDYADFSSCSSGSSLRQAALAYQVPD